MKRVGTILEAIGDRNRFACFSPLVMQLTFVIELCLATWVLLTRKRSKNIYLIAAILVFLSLFQLAEYAICENMPGSDDMWLTIGMISITLLPPLGLHLTSRLAGSKRTWIPWVAYATAAVYIYLFVFGSIVGAPVCEGNYIITHFDNSLWSRGYGVFYYGWLLVAIAKQFYYLGHHGHDPGPRRMSLRWLLIGYLAFVVPSTLIVVFNDGTPYSGLPSIMCGFALLLALIIAIFTSRYAEKIK